jgi:ATP-dependent DNA helicase RecG
MVRIEDASGVLVLRFIHFYPSQLKQFADGVLIRAMGEIRRGFHGDEMVHPKTREVVEGSPLAESLTPVYPTVNGVTQPMLRKLIRQELKALPLPETLPEPVIARLGCKVLPMRCACCIHHRRNTVPASCPSRACRHGSG